MKRWGYAFGVRWLTTSLIVTMMLATGACRRRAQHPLPAAAPDWMQRVAYEQVVAASPGAQPLGPAFVGAADREDGRQKFTVPFAQGHCYLISAVADRATAEELYVNLWDPSGDRVAKDKNGTPYMVLEHCAKLSGQYSFELKVTRGYGHFLALVYEQAQPGQVGRTTPLPDASGSVASLKPREAEPTPAATATPAGGAQDEALGSQVDARGGKVAPGGRRIGGHYSGEGKSSDWYPTLESGKCYWFVAAAKPAAGGIKLILGAPTGKELVSQQAAGSPAELKYCPAVGAMYHFRVEAVDPAARYKAGVFASTQ